MIGKASVSCIVTSLNHVKQLIQSLSLSQYRVCRGNYDQGLLFRPKARDHDQDRSGRHDSLDYDNDNDNDRDAKDIIIDLLNLFVNSSTVRHASTYL